MVFDDLRKSRIQHEAAMREREEAEQEARKQSIKERRNQLKKDHETILDYYRQFSYPGGSLTELMEELKAALSRGTIDYRMRGSIYYDMEDPHDYLVTDGVGVKNLIEAYLRNDFVGATKILIPVFNKSHAPGREKATAREFTFNEIALHLRLSWDRPVGVDEYYGWYGIKITINKDGFQVNNQVVSANPEEIIETLKNVAASQSWVYLSDK
jgi:hypothetical protein